MRAQALKPQCWATECGRWTVSFVFAHSDSRAPQYNSLDGWKMCCWLASAQRSTTQREQMDSIWICTLEQFIAGKPSDGLRGPRIANRPFKWMAALYKRTIDDSDPRHYVADHYLRYCILPWSPNDCARVHRSPTLSLSLFRTRARCEQRQRE